MKRKNIILVMLMVFSFGLFTIQSCKKEDDTTYTTKQAFTTPVVTSPAVRPDGTVFAPDNKVTLTWESANSGGDPVKWDIYFGTDAEPALFKEGSTAKTITVDVEDGTTYYWYVEIKDARKIVTTSAVNSFVAIDGTNPAISIALDVTTDVKTSVGLDLDPDDVVDLRFLIVNKADNSIAEVIDDGYASEHFDGLGDLPDGEYLLAVDVGATIDAGDFNTAIALSMSLSFEQLGILSTSLDFPAVMNNEKTCAYYRTYLASVKKVGAVYTISKAISDWTDPTAADPSVMVGTWSGKDVGYASEITSTVADGKLLFEGIGRGWMMDWWGEVIVTQNPVEAVFDPVAGTFSIANQEIMTTTYDDGKGGGPQPQPAYFIEGSITANFCGGPDLVISYDFIQPDGAGGIAQYKKLKKFTASISLDPSGKKALQQIMEQRDVPYKR